MPKKDESDKRRSRWGERMLFVPLVLIGQTAWKCGFLAHFTKAFSPGHNIRGSFQAVAQLLTSLPVSSFFS